MILSFMKYFPSHGLTLFEEKILADHKIHSFRHDKRWRPGMKIHFYMGARTKQMRLFKEGVVISTQRMTVRFTGDDVVITIDAKKFVNEQCLRILQNDGLNWQQFRMVFPANWSGKIIHWTDFKYS